MDVDFSRVRPFDGSRASGFEELVCQLAHCEDVPMGSEFYRVKAPDAGVECYWKFPDGSEWGWQAKYFLNVPTETQWKQIDKSVKTALKKHPSLTKYYVCLPRDREDPRVPEQEWLKDKWERHTRTWKKLRKGTGDKVDFEYWGQHEIVLRLSCDEHAGRRYFWFGEIEFTDGWMREQINRAIENVRDRYAPAFFDMPQLNITTGIEDALEGLARSERLYDLLTQQREAVAVALRELGGGDYSHLPSTFHPQWVREHFEDTVVQADELFEGDLESLRIRSDLRLPSDILPFKDRLQDHEYSIVYTAWAEQRWRDLAVLLVEELSNLPQSPDSLLDLTSPRTLASASLEGISSLLSIWRGLQIEFGRNDQEERALSEARTKFSTIRGCLDRLSKTLHSAVCGAAEMSALLIHGESLVGKTHLLCSFAESRASEGYPTLLVLGQLLTESSDPIGQLIRQLSIDCTSQEFLGALDAWAEAKGSRCLVLVDALNEGSGLVLWRKHLPGFVHDIRKHSWLSVGFTVKSSTKWACIDPADVGRILVEARHPGFRDNLEEALDTFCASFGLRRGVVQPMMPEFAIPGFLLFVCRILKEQGAKELSTTNISLDWVFKSYIDLVHQRLWHKEKLDYSQHRNLISEALASVAAEMWKSDSQWLDYTVAETTANRLLPSREDSRSLMHALIEEDLVSVDIIRPSHGHADKVVRFAFQRMRDYFIAKYLLDQYDESVLKRAGSKAESELGLLVANTSDLAHISDVLSATAALFPSTAGKELSDVFPALQDSTTYLESFIDSLLWRGSSSLLLSTDALVSSIVGKQTELAAQLFANLIRLALGDNDSYNAHFLHGLLCEMDLPQRDQVWTTALRVETLCRTELDAILSWIKPARNRDKLPDEVAERAALVLSWALSSTDRVLRDQVTKVLVLLLEKRMPILRRLLQAFAYVNDPYISERIFAIAYGVAMRARHGEDLTKLAEDVYALIFVDGKPPVHILLRDYARGVIETALKSGCSLSFSYATCCPPYDSAISLGEISRIELRTRYGKAGYASLWSSIMYSDTNFPGDFGKYVIDPRCEYFAQFKEGSVRSGEHISRENLISPMIVEDWILQRVIDLGWTPMRFMTFDYSVSSLNRFTSIEERIGKKYQWIALHQIFAALADNFQYVDWDSAGTYSGPWQLGLRDTDPSFARMDLVGDRWHVKEKTWWASELFGRWDSPESHHEWVSAKAPLPDPRNLIKIVNPQDRQVWWTLSGAYMWQQPVPKEENRLAETYRQIWYLLHSYLVRTEDSSAVYEWAKRQDFMGRWMPEEHTIYGVFFGELLDLTPTSNWFHEWTDSGRSDSKIPAPVLFPAQRWMLESGSDRGIRETVSLLVPDTILADGLDLRWAGREGSFIDKSSKIVAQDPSSNEEGPGALLVRADRMKEFLNDQGLSILWTLLGEKRLTSPGFRDWQGTLDISGAYRMQDGKLVGTINAWYKKPV